jgi:hypothetical protein
LINGGSNQCPCTLVSSFRRFGRRCSRAKGLGEKICADLAHVVVVQAEVEIGLLNAFGYVVEARDVHRLHADRDVRKDLPFGARHDVVDERLLQF